MGLNAPSSYGVVTVNATATTIFSSSPGRRSYVIFNNGQNAIYVGFDLNVTANNGIPIQPQDNFSQTGEGIWMGSIFGITGTGSSEIRTWEVIQ